MATGDRIYIADKETLDTVDTNVSYLRTLLNNTKVVVDDTKTNTQTLQINTTTTNTRLGTKDDNAGTFSVFAFLKSIRDNTISLLSNASSKSVAPDKLKYNVVKVPATLQTLTSYFDITRPGSLYSVLISGVGNQYAAVKITVDDSVLLYMGSDQNSNYCGGLVIGSKIPQRYVQVQRIITDIPLTFGETLQKMGSICSPLPIRVNSSVKIECINPSSSDMYLEYTYIED